MGQQVYFAKEKSDFWSRQCCGALRELEMKITDSSEREVMQFERPFRCTGICFPGFLQELQVSGPGGLYGTVVQEWSLFENNFTVKDEAGKPVLKIIGPCLFCDCLLDIEFEIWNLERSVQVGRITKQWSGLLKEVFTDADNFGISFPMDLDVKIKATLLGAVFLIDFMFFEEAAGN